MNPNKTHTEKQLAGYKKAAAYRLGKKRPKALPIPIFYLKKKNISETKTNEQQTNN